MTLLLPLQMAYSLVGERYHEINGTVMLILFLVHHVLNRKWTGSALKGKYTARRLFQTVLDILLLVFMIAQPVSGILMSKYLYPFIRVENASAAAREIHLVLAYWGFVLMCIHAGTHFMPVFSKLKKKGKAVSSAVLAAIGCVSVYGAFAFSRRQLAEYMFRKTLFAFFDFYEPKVYFFLDYLAIMVLFFLVGLLLIQACASGNKKQTEK